MNDWKDAIATTIRHYQRNADMFWHGTRDHDISQNYAAFLGALGDRKPLSILDLGCGPGRDLRYFRDLGHRAVGIDGVDAFVAMARTHSGCEVWQQDFLALDLPDGEFDGVFANASVFHVPKSEILRVLGEIRESLTENGVLFCSNPRGDDRESVNGGRFGVFYRDDTWLSLVPEAGFDPLFHYWRPEGVSRERQPWLASLWRRRENV